MQGATAASEGLAPIGAQEQHERRIGLRRLVAAAAGVVVAFAAAFAVGSMTKQHSVAPPAPAAGHLAEPLAVQPTQQVAITPVGAAATIPGLKPKPAPKPKHPQTSAASPKSAPNTVVSPPTVTVNPTPVAPVSPTPSTPQSHSGGGGGSSGSSGSSSSGSSGSSSSGSSGSSSSGGG